MHRAEGVQSCVGLCMRAWGLNLWRVVGRMHRVLWLSQTSTRVSTSPPRRQMNTAADLHHELLCEEHGVADASGEASWAVQTFLAHRPQPAPDLAEVAHRVTHAQRTPTPCPKGFAQCTAETSTAGLTGGARLRSGEARGAAPARHVEKVARGAHHRGRRPGRLLLCAPAPAHTHSAPPTLVHRPSVHCADSVHTVRVCVCVS